MRRRPAPGRRTPPASRPSPRAAIAYPAGAPTLPKCPTPAAYHRRRTIRRPACSLGRMEAASPGLGRGSTASGRCRWRGGRGGGLTDEAEEVHPGASDSGFIGTMRASTSCFRGCGPWAAPCSRTRPVSDLDRIAVQDSIDFSSPTRPLPRRVWSMSRRRAPCTMLRAGACDAACRSAHRRSSCWLSTTAACRPRRPACLAAPRRALPPRPLPAFAAMFLASSIEYWPALQRGIKEASSAENIRLISLSIDEGRSLLVLDTVLDIADNLSIPDLLQYFRLWIAINRIQIQGNTQDTFAWRLSPSGYYSQESSYKILCQSKERFLSC